MKNTIRSILALALFASQASAQTLLNYVPQVGVSTTASSGACGPNTPTTLSGSNPTIISSYCGGTEFLSNASAQAPTIAEAGASGFPAGWFTTLCNINTGAQTLTPAAGTVGGAATKAIAAGTTASPICITIVSDGVSNYGIANATVAASSNGAAQTYTPGAPTGTSSSSFVMMGLGSTCTITPTKTGRVLFVVLGRINNNTSGGEAQASMNYGTGAAPMNGVTATGTALTQGASIDNNNPTFWASFHASGIATGLTLNTAVWWDMQARAINTGTTAMSLLSCYALEF